MRRQRVRAAATAAVAVLAVAVAAGPGAPPVRAQAVVTDIESATFGTLAGATARGHVRVDFHGDEAAGCAEARLCDVSGTVTWQPHGGGALFTFAYRERGRRYVGGVLTFGDGGGSDASQVPETAARVRRGKHLCVDVAAPEIAAIGLGPDRGTALTARIASTAPGVLDSDSLRTRCAGPSLTDIAAVLPAHRLSRGALRRGGQRLDFSADAPFAAHGLAGRVRSNVVVRVSRASYGSLQNEGRGAIVDRQRVISLQYRVERVSGTMRAEFAGLADPDQCDALDSCGVTGRATAALRVAGGSASIAGNVPPARRHRDDLRRALGLLPGKPRRRHNVFGYVDWENDRGSVTSELERDGLPDCRDTQPAAPNGSIQLDARRGRLHASYGGAAIATSDPLRTRCPGPGAGDVTRVAPLATGTLPLSALRKRRVTLRLTRGRTFRGNGYRGTLRPDLTVVMRRVAVRERIFVEREDELGPLLKHTVLKALARP